MRASGWHRTKLKAGPPPITAGGDAESQPQARGLPDGRWLWPGLSWWSRVDTPKRAVPSGPAQCGLAQLLPVGHPMKRTGLLREHQRSSTNGPEGCYLSTPDLLLLRWFAAAIVFSLALVDFCLSHSLNNDEKDDSISTPSTSRPAPSPRAISCARYRSVPSGQRVVARRVICC